MTPTTNHEGRRIACPGSGGSGFRDGEESGSRCTGPCGGGRVVEVIQTVALGRTAYRVVRGHDDTIPYFLIGARGALSSLMRNGPRPERLFTSSVRNFTRGSPDVWFTDKAGELAVL